MISNSSSIEQYDFFCQTHNSKEIEISGIIWDYIVGGKGKETIFITPVGIGKSKHIFRYILSLEKNYRIIAPSFPSNITNVAEYIKGITTILNAESVEKVHFVGFDACGMIGQCFVGQYPEKVDNLVLIHTLVPDSSSAKKIERYASIDSLLPSFLYPKISKIIFSKIFKSKSAVTEDPDFWLNLFADSFSKDRQRLWFKIVIDYLKNYQFSIDDLDNWSGSLLIIESEKDGIFGNKDLRQQVRDTYPYAEFYTFYEGNQINNALFRVEEIVSLIEDFLSKAK